MARSQAIERFERNNPINSTAQRKGTKMQMQDIRFGFKETVKRDSDGKAILDDKGQPIKVKAPDAVVIQVPQFSAAVMVKNEKGEEVDDLTAANPEDLQAILDSNDPKQIRLLFDAANEIILNHMKLQIEEARQEDKDIWPKKGTQKDANGKEFEVILEPADTSWIDYQKLTFAYIASLPPSKRGAEGIPEELWDEFGKDYKDVIVQHGKTEKQAEAGAKILLKKFAPVKMNKKVVASLKTNLLIWVEHSSQPDKFVKIYQNLLQKADELLAADEDAIVAAV